MDKMQQALMILATIESLVGIVKQMKDSAEFSRQLTEEERKQLDERIANLGLRPHWTPSTSP